MKSLQFCSLKNSGKLNGIFDPIKRSIKESNKIGWTEILAKYQYNGG